MPASSAIFSAIPASNASSGFPVRTSATLSGGCDTDPTPSQRSTWEQFGRLALVRHDCPNHGSTTLARMRVEGGA